MRFAKLGCLLLCLSTVLGSAAWAQTPQYAVGVLAGGVVIPPTPNPATGLSIGTPDGVAVDAHGNFYLTSHAVFQVNSVGTMTLFAGGNGTGYSGDGGPATNAQVAGAGALAFDTNGNLYFSDPGNNVVRMVSTSGIISTVAGNGTAGYSGDGGPATSAQLAGAGGIAVDQHGNLYIADTFNQVIRMVTTSGIISTFAGNGTGGFSGDGGPATSAELYSPSGVAVDGAGNVYICDTQNSRIRKVAPGGTISTFAGVGNSGTTLGDGGPATSAQVTFPAALSVDGVGNVYFASGFSRIRKVTLDGIIHTVAGTAAIGYSGDGGPATSAEVSFPKATAVDGAGNLYIADTTNNRIRLVPAATGAIATVAGNGTNNFSGDGGPAISAQIDASGGTTVDASGNLYFVDGETRVRKVDTSGNIGTIAGTGVSGFSGDEGPATSAQFNNPQGLAADTGGNIYVADTNNYRIREITKAGTVITIAGNGNPGYTGDGGPATQASLTSLSGIAVDSTGNVYLTDAFNNVVRMVTPAGTIGTIAGNGQRGYSGDGGPATSAQLDNPKGVAVDSNGNVFIADTFNNVIRMVTGGMIYTVVGNGQAGYSGDGGPASQAQLNGPDDVAVDSQGDLWIADTQNEAVRLVIPSSTASSSSAGARAAHPRTIGALIQDYVQAGIYATYNPNPCSSCTGNSGLLTSVEPSPSGGAVAIDGTTSVTGLLCTYAISPPGGIFAANADNNGFFNVLTGPGCLFSAQSNSDWIYGVTTIGSSVTFNLKQNSGPPRPGKILVDSVSDLGQTASLPGAFSVDQTNCTYTWSWDGPLGASDPAMALPENSVNVGPNGLPVFLTVVAAPGCTWSVSASSSPMVPVTLNPNPAAGTGNGQPQQVTVQFGSTTEGVQYTITGTGFNLVINQFPPAPQLCSAATATGGTTAHFSPRMTSAGSVTVADVQAEINQALGMASPQNDLNEDGVINSADVQIIANAALGLGCSAY